MTSWIFSPEKITWTTERESRSYFDYIEKCRQREINQKERQILNLHRRRNRIRGNHLSNQRGKKGGLGFYPHEKGQPFPIQMSYYANRDWNIENIRKEMIEVEH